jgi:hypothetical protein
MRNAWRTQSVVMVAAILAAAGCKTTQPDRVEARTASVVLRLGGIVPLYNCWEEWQDTNADGIGDVNLGVVTCDQVGSAQRPVPWRYSMGIYLIRAGTTTEEVVTSVDGLIGSSIEAGDTVDDFVSMTEYDNGKEPIPDKPHQGDIYFINGNKVSLGSPIYLSSLGLDLGPSSVLTATPTFDFNVNSGDTVVVRARKQAESDAPPFLPSNPRPALQLRGVLAIGGVQVAANGTSVSSTDDQAGISFSFTVH